MEARATGRQIECGLQRGRSAAERDSYRHSRNRTPEGNPAVPWVGARLRICLGLTLLGLGCRRTLRRVIRYLPLTGGHPPPLIGMIN